MERTVRTGYRRRGGFSLVETMVAVAMISVVGIVGSNALLYTTKAVTGAKYTQKASSLAEMIFQQYDSYSTINYLTLNQFDRTNVSVATFFNRSDNLGFDRMSITTQTKYSLDHSTAAVSVILAWNEGSRARSVPFVKTYSQSSQVAGGSVQIYLKVPCNGLTDPTQIIADCPGLNNFSVSGPPASGTNPAVFTDVNGYAMLKNIEVGSSVRFKIAVSTTVSNYDVPNTDPAFAQGYYVTDPVTGSYSTVLSTYATVSLDSVGQLLVLDFKPAGTITGHIINHSTVDPAQPTSGMGVRLLPGPAFWQSASNTYIVDTASGIVVTSKADGTYSFNNVVPSTFSISVDGRAGSAPTVQPGSSGFVWGYTGQGQYNGTLAVNSSGTPPSVGQDVNVVVDGWYKLSLSNLLTSFPVSNYSVPVITPETGAPLNPQNVPSQVTAPSDSLGVLRLYNVVTAEGLGRLAGAQVYNTEASGLSPFGSKIQWTTYASAVGVENDFTLTVEPSYRLLSTLIDSSGQSSNITVTQFGLENNYHATSDVSGKLSLTGFFPIGAYGDPNGSGKNPSVPFVPQGSIVFQNQFVPQTVQMNPMTIDSATGAPAAHATINVVEQSGTASITSDANGHFSGAPVALPYLNMNVAPGTMTLFVVCDNVFFTCALCNDQSTCSTAQGTYQLNTTQSIVNFPNNAPSLNGYLYTIDLRGSISTPGNVVTTVLPVTLVSQRVQGHVVDGTQIGIAGVTVNCPGASNGSQTTDSSGAFDLSYCTVSGRTSSSAPGSVTVTMPAQRSFAATTMVQPLAKSADPSTPLSVTVVVSGTVSNGGL